MQGLKTDPKLQYTSIEFTEKIITKSCLKRSGDILVVIDRKVSKKVIEYFSKAREDNIPFRIFGYYRGRYQKDDKQVSDTVDFVHSPIIS